MAEHTPEWLGAPEVHRSQHARLRFIPNMVLFDHLKPFYRNPETVQRVGQHGLFLYSINAMPVHHRPYQSGFEPGAAIAMSRVDRISYDIGHLNENQEHLPMADHLRFSKPENGGITIQLGVVLNQPIADSLVDTPFMRASHAVVNVALTLADGQHAGGTVMQQTAERLDTVLKDRRTHAGTDHIELVVT